MDDPAPWASQSPEFVTNNTFRDSLVESPSGLEIERIVKEYRDSKTGEVEYLVKWLGHEE